MASKKTFGARQTTWTRYIASVGLETTAKDAGVSPSTLQDFILSPVTKRASEKKSFQPLIESRPTAVAREHNRKLLHNLSQRRLERVTGEQRVVPRKTRALIRVTRATTREREQLEGRRRANVILISEGYAYEPFEEVPEDIHARVVKAYKVK